MVQHSIIKNNYYFLSKNVYDTGYAKPLGQKDEHLKLFVKQNDSEGYGAIGFGLGAKINEVKNQKRFDMLYCIDENEFNGSVTIQLRMKDLQN